MQIPGGALEMVMAKIDNCINAVKFNAFPFLKNSTRGIFTSNSNASF